MPGELPCFGKQAPALARRKTCQGLICVFVHRCASKRSRGTSHDDQKRAIVKKDSTFSELQLVNALYMHYNVFIRVNIHVGK